MANQKPKQIPSLDGLRAISILLVIVAHVAISYEDHITLRYWLDHGRLGVRIFFVISGFLITSLLLDEKREFGRISLAAFYGRRALRILPAFYVYVAVVVILNAFHLIKLPPYN